MRSVAEIYTDINNLVIRQLDLMDEMRVLNEQIVQLTAEIEGQDTQDVATIFSRHSWRTSQGEPYGHYWCAECRLSGVTPKDKQWRDPCPVWKNKLKNFG